MGCDHFATNREMTVRKVLVLVLLAGCASVPQPTFDRGAATDKQFTQDDAACDLEGLKARAALPPMSDYEGMHRRVYGACMRAKGYAAAK